MIKAILITVFVAIGQLCFSQNVLEKIANESCHCISNINVDTLPGAFVNRQLNICLFKAASLYKKELKEERSLDVGQLFFTDADYIRELTSSLMSNCPGYLGLMDNIEYSYRKSDSLKSVYDENVIFLYGGNKYYKNKRYYKLSNLDAEFGNSLDGFNEYLQYRQRSSLGSKLMLVTLVSYVGAITQLEKNNELAAGLGILGFSANIAAIPFFEKGARNLQKSVWLRNRDEIINRFEPKKK